MQTLPARGFSDGQNLAPQTVQGVFNFRNCLNSLPFKILNQMIGHHWNPCKTMIAT